MSVKVIKVGKDEKGRYSTYIGRAFAGYPRSPFYNPFHIGPDGDRREVIAKFAAYWYAPQQKQLRELALHFIKDNDVLKCWCKPFACHGDIIAGYLDMKRQEQLSL